MTQILQLRHQRRGPALNPYIVVADVAINLLLVIIVYFLVTARVAEAVYAADEKKFKTAAAAVRGLNSEYRLSTRNGPFLDFRLPNTTLFSDASHVSPSGVQTMRGMAAMLRSKECAPLVQGIRLTVSYPAEWNVLNAQKNADGLVEALRAAGLASPIVTSARSQRDPNISNKRELSETDFVIEFMTPAHTLARQAPSPSDG